MFRQITACRKPASLRRKLLGLCTVLWLNMAVLPCALAFESGDICPHCPPEDMHEMASHHGHGEPQATPPCATAQSECCDLGEVSVDSRGGQLQVKPVSEVVLITGPPIAAVPRPASQQRYCAADPPDATGVSPPLHVLFCVYLD